MMEESLHGEFRPTSLGHRQYKSRRAAGLPKTFCATLMHTFDPTLQHRSTRSASLDVQLTHTPRRAKNRHIAPLTVIRLTVAAIRRWRERARSQQQLRELSDHMLRDIGLRREDRGYEFPNPLARLNHAWVIRDPIENALEWLGEQQQRQLVFPM
jgi:uncharacterized protein YjiS (DUF1127 family)